MSRRAMLAAILAAALLLATSGCWDKRELDEMLHAVSLYIDLEGEQLRVTAEILTPGTASPEGAPAEHTIVTALGEGFQDALRNIRQSSRREMVVSHVDYLVIGEGLARAGLADLVNALSHDYDMRSHIAVAVTPGKASDLLQASLIATRHAEVFVGLLETSARSGPGGGRATLLDLQRALADQPAADPLLDKLVLLPPPPVEHLTQHTQANTGEMGGGMEAGMGTSAGAEQAPPLGAINGAALFQGDRLVGFAEELEAQGLRWALAPVQGRNVWVPVEGGGFEIRVWHSRPRLTIRQVHGELELRIQVEAEGDLLELAGPVDSDSPAALTQLEVLAAQYIEAEIAAGVAYAESLGTDPLRAGLYLYRWYPDLWQQLKEDWPQPLADAVHIIEARVRILSTGILRRNAPASQSRAGGP